MDTPIIASYRFTKEEYLRAQRFAVRHSVHGRLIYRITTIIGVIIVLSGIASVWNHTVGWIGLLYTLIIGGVFFSMPLFARRTALKLYAQDPNRDREVKWQISDERVVFKTELTAAENSWASFLRVIRVRDGFLLYPNDRAFNWLPSHAFQAPEDVERFAELAKLKVKEYRDLA